MIKKGELYMPAEWHEQQFVQLTWPHEKSDWAYMLEEVECCFIEIAKAISCRERLLVITPDKAKTEDTLREAGATMSNIVVFACETNDTWARDHGFITLLGDEKPHYLDFCFNGWGKKFESSLDNAINKKIYDAGIVKGVYENMLEWVLEGGSIESDGKGTILTTSQCLMAPNRNNMLQYNLEGALCSLLRSKRVLWLDYGNLIGDDTDGHIEGASQLAAQLRRDKQTVLVIQLRRVLTDHGPHSSPFWCHFAPLCSTLPHFVYIIIHT